MCNSETKELRCEVFDKLFKHRSDLKRHLLTHTKLKVHESNICIKTLGEKLYGFAECEKQYNASYERDKHLRMQQQLQLKCKIPRSIVYDYLV